MVPNFFSLKFYLSLTLSIIILLAFIYLLKPFFGVIFWAGILSFFMYPLFKKINRLLRYHKSISALFTILIFVLFILIPSILFFLLLYTQLQNVIFNLNLSFFEKLFLIFSNLKNKLIFSHIYPYIEPYIQNLQNQLPQHISNLIQYIVHSLGNIFITTFGTIFNMVLTLFTLFYFLIDGEKILNITKELLPVESSSKENLLKKISEILKAILYGSVLTSIVQGVLALIIYLVLSVPQPFLFAFLTMLASYMPFLGTTFIWLPLSLYFLFIGSYFKAILLFLLCALTVAQIDNILKPFIIGGKTKIHNLLMFFAVLGGIYRFGITGLFLGPIILGLFLSILEIYRSLLNSKENTSDSLS
ncbi:MAG: AI-2E family transporter [Caldimicrobium sp.]|jgi:predicted PurR-regulated permease PerM